MPTLENLEKRWLREGAQNDIEYADFLARRVFGEPIHRILGWREFWGLKFLLSPATLEPRPDSETLIEVLLKLTPQKTQALRFLDIGTGTGCLLLAALYEFPNAAGVGIDISAEAVVMAQKNADLLGLSGRAAFYPLNYHDTGALLSLGCFDIILCNPPYIPTSDIKGLQAEVKNFDPIAALDGGADGLAPYRIIAPHLKNLLAPGGIAVFEIGYDQAAAVQNIMTQRNLTVGPPYRDLGGNDRALIVTYH